MSISPETLIAAVFEVRFGHPYGASTPEDKKRFFSELRVAQRKLRNLGIETVTVPAIASWANGSHPPTRQNAAQFFHGYLQLVDKNKKNVLGSETDKFRDLVTYLLTHGGEVVIPNPQLIAQTGVEKSKKPALPRHWRGDQHTWDLAESLAGTYQIVRPSAGKIDHQLASERYVLEVLSINPHSSVSNHRLLMYSHTQPNSKFLYRGDIDINTQYLSGVLRREYENNAAYEAFRSIMMFVMSPRDCLSGVMLRGVTGKTGKRAVAVPFVAIRSPHSSTIMETSSLEEKYKDFYEIGNSLIVGEVRINDKVLEPIFSFCKKLFETLKGTIQHGNGFVLHAIDLKELCNLLDGYSNRKGFAYFYKWQKVVERCAWSDTPPDPGVLSD